MLAIISPVGFTTDKIHPEHELYCIVLPDLIRLPATLANRAFNIPEMHMAARSIILDTEPKGGSTTMAGIFFNPCRPQHQEHALALNLFHKNIQEIEARQMVRGNRAPLAVDITPEMMAVIEKNQLHYGEAVNFAVTRERQLLVNLCRPTGQCYGAVPIPLSFLSSSQVEAWGVCDNIPLPEEKGVIERIEQVTHPIAVHFGCHLN